MRGYLAVRINDGVTDKIVTDRVRDLRFRKTAPGGHHSASCTLVLPPHTFDDLGPADDMVISDARTGDVLWGGKTENPGVTDGPAGESYDLAALGNTILASDRSEAMLFIDKSFEHWRRGLSANIAPSATTELAVDPSTGEPALLMQFNPGQPIGAGSFAAMIYDLSDFPNLYVGGIKAEFVSGVTSANWGIRMVSSDGTSDDFTFSTTVRNNNRKAGSDYPVDRQWVVLRITRAAGGATNVTTDTIWTAFPEITVTGQLVDRDGAHVVTPRFTHLLASEIVDHMIGRGLLPADRLRSEIASTTAQIDQFAFLDGARPAEVLDQLALFEPDHYWGIGASTSSGLYEFWYREWPTEPRYEISTSDGFSAPGGEVDLCNEITVYWTDPSGDKQATKSTAVVPQLGSRTRAADSVTLPEGLGSEANALLVGQQVLASKADPPTAGTASVRRPILDRLAGKYVMPWEIEPGHIVRVRETGEDLRLTETEYVDAECAATLTLSTPALSTEEIVAALARKT